MADAGPRRQDGRNRLTAPGKLARELLGTERGTRRRMLDLMRRFRAWLRSLRRGQDTSSAAGLETAGPGPAGNGWVPGWPTTPQQQMPPVSAGPANRDSARERKRGERLSRLEFRIGALSEDDRKAFEDAVLREIRKSSGLRWAYDKGLLPIAGDYAGNAYERELQRSAAQQAGSAARPSSEASSRFARGPQGEQGSLGRGASGPAAGMRADMSGGPAEYHRGTARAALTSDTRQAVPEMRQTGSAVRDEFLRSLLESGAARVSVTGRPAPAAEASHTVGPEGPGPRETGHDHGAAAAWLHPSGQVSPLSTPAGSRRDSAVSPPVSPIGSEGRALLARTSPSPGSPGPSDARPGSAVARSPVQPTPTRAPRKAGRR